jgi:hypothetical protein
MGPMTWQFTRGGIADLACSCGVESVELIEAHPFHVAIVVHAPDRRCRESFEDELWRIRPVYTDVRVLTCRSLVSGLSLRDRLSLVEMRLSAWWIRVRASLLRLR